MHRIVVLALAALTAAACVRGSDKSEKTQEEASPSLAGGPGALSPSEFWQEGKLPPQVTQGEPRKGGEVVVQLYTDPPSLNNIVDSDWWSARITEHHIYEALVGVSPYDDPDFELIPELAERWEVSEDKLTYTFHLRRGVKWHDGQPFSAKDVVATFDKIQDPTTKAVHVRSYTQELEHYKALDDYTVEFKWKRPYFLALDTPFSDVPIQPAHVIAPLTGAEYNNAATNPLNRHPVGTGPWKFVTWESDKKIVVERFDDYWGEKAHLDRVIFRIVKDPTVGLQLAEREELDVVTRIQEEDWQKMGSRKVLGEKFHRSRYHDANYAWIGWNQLRPFFQDVRVRKAMTLLVDREGIIDKMLHQIPRPTTCHFYWASKACDPNLAPLPHDPAAAAKLLDEAGWKDSDGDGWRDKDGVKFAFTFMIPASSVNIATMANLMKESFQRAGIQMTTQKVEWAAFTKRLREHEFDACSLLWGGGPRGEPTQIWHSSSIEGGSNYISFDNPKVDALLEKARVEFDEDKRNEMYREFGRILHEEQPYTFLYVRARLSLVHRRVKGVKESLYYWWYRDWWVGEEPEETKTAKAE